MKKILIIASLFLLSFTTNPEKKFHFDFSEGQVGMLWNTLQFCKESIQTSQSTAIDVKNATKMIDSIQVVIANQYRGQLNAVLDTVKPKGNTNKK